MKKLELNQMENLEGGKGGFGTSFACVTYLIALAALTVPSAGTAVVLTAGIGAIACGTALGHGLNSDNWW